MPDHASEPSETPHVETIRQLVRLMHRFDLTALDWTNDKTSIRLRRGRGFHAVQGGTAPPPPVLPQAPPIAPTPVQPAAPPSQNPATREGTFIRSPMVGTFYESSSPDAKPYVSVGSTVRPETTVCMIEAMKVFTEINAGLSGTIVEVMVKNGQPVEFDQPLFRVETN